MLQMKAKSCVLILVATASAAFVAAPANAKTAKPAKLGVFTQNLYLGADLSPAIGALAADPLTASPAIATTWAHVQATDFPSRAKRIAAEIAKRRPVIVGLQEAVTWSTDEVSDGVISPPNAATLQYDFVAILQKELKRRGMRYDVAATATNVDIEVTYLPPGASAPRDLRMTDHDVILVRSGVTVANAQSHEYAAALPLPIGGGFPLPRGWASVDVTWKGRQFRYVSTHLEDGVEQISRPQVDELIAGPLATSMPVVLAGDFNSDAAAVPAVAPSVYADVTAAGFADSWSALKPSKAGLTWGEAELLDNKKPTLSQRLDYVFTKGGASAVSIEIVGAAPKDRIHGLWPSDHAGVSATISIP